MTSNHYMFSSLMKHKIGGNMKSYSIVTIQLNMLIFSKFQLLKTCLIHTSLHVARVIDLYSTSVPCQATLYFLLFQDIRFPPRNTQYPMVDRLSMGQQAQSTSQYLRTLVFRQFSYNNPFHGLPSTYIRMQSTAFQKSMRVMHKLTHNYHK